MILSTGVLAYRQISKREGCSVKSRNITVALIAIALGAAAWVVLSNRQTEQGQGSSVGTEPKMPPQEATLPAPAIPFPVLADTNSAGRKEESQAPVDASRKLSAGLSTFSNSQISRILTRSYPEKSNIRSKDP
jgi:hypothetical protein